MFRTFNASITLQEQLEELTSGEGREGGREGGREKEMEEGREGGRGGERGGKSKVAGVGFLVDPANLI